MMDYRNIDFHPDARDHEALSRRLSDYDRQELQRQMDGVIDPEDRPPGRPRIELDPSLARQVQAARQSGESQSSVTRRYGAVGGFSRWWLLRAERSGRLDQLAAG